MKENKLLFNYIPLIGAICIALGLFLGKSLYQNTTSDSQLVFKGNPDGKVDEVIEKVVENYVDQINKNEITEYAIIKVLSHLDPHSSYIPPKEVKGEEERMTGKFDGIGIEFRIIEDTLLVVNAIAGGPSQKAGIKSGDRIIGINKNTISLGKLKTDSLVTLLRGKAGSIVELIVFRPFDEGEITIPVMRGEIPIYSIDTEIMINNEIGYLKINRFSYQTHTEFKNAAKTLKNLGARKLIIDVRDNPGGSLNAVVKICDELLPSGKNILYTKGAHDRETYNSTFDGTFMNMDIAVITNQNSASASEILAGALQDNDKAIIVGRRTFGKGLVQAVLPLDDKSRIHLTIARYYTPSGRCIQKPFEKDNVKGYHNDELDRWENGELYSRDSIKFNDSLTYKTLKGRTVYGGGGIIPDEFVGYDTTMNSTLLFDLLSKNLIRNYALKFYTAKKVKGFDFEAAAQFLSKQNLILSFKNYCVENQVTWNEKDWATSKKYIVNKLHAYILRVRFGNSGYYKKSAEQDKDILKAIKVLTLIN